MTPLPRTDVISGLLKKGFKQESGAKHDKLRLYVGDKRTGITTSVSRGKQYRDYGEDLIDLVKKELRLDTKKQLMDLIECPMSYEMYIKHLRVNKGFQLISL